MFEQTFYLITGFDQISILFSGKLIKACYAHLVALNNGSFSAVRN